MSKPSTLQPVARVVNALPERDPRVDPQADDKLTLSDHTYRVVWKRDGRLVYYLSTIAGRRRCSVRQWIAWCHKNNAQVEK